MWKKRRSRSVDIGAELESWCDQLEAATGANLVSDDLVLRADETFRLWCERLAKASDDGKRKGLKVDGKPFRLDDRPAMAWLYDQIPSTEDEAYRLVLVMMKCSQVGFTVMEMLACIYVGLRFGPATVGMFLPDMNLADIKSAQRFVPIVRSVPAVHRLMTAATEADVKKAGEGNTRVRRLGQALYVFSWTSGKVTTESIPMDMLSFDEVQEMTLEQIEKTVERLSASTLRFILMGSTANWPDVDIHHWYLKGTQHQFHTLCKTCGEMRPLDEYFPQCIQWRAERKAYDYVCPNGHWLDDTQHGEWLAKHPERDPPVDPAVPRRDRPLRIRSIHFPQMLSPTISATDIMDSYRTAESMKNFYNRKLGKPWTDPSQVPVTLQHMHECERAGIAAGLQWKTRGRDCYMGIDQMGNYNVVVVKERMPDGRKAVVHMEEIYSETPFARCDEIMAAFGVIVCVVEINPNYNDAKLFANRWQGRVFICDSFGQIQEGMVVWGDGSRVDVSDRRTNEEDRDRYTLRMDQYKCMQWSLANFTASPPTCLFPDRRGLVQEVQDKGVKVRAEVAPRAWLHFTKTALVTEISDEDKKKGIKHYKRSVRKIGIDPHFSYANMLCDVAWSRAYGTAGFIMPEIGPLKTPETSKAEALGLHGLPDNVAAMIQILPAGQVCGRCQAYDPDAPADARQAMCTARDILVQARDPGCPLFDAREAALVTG